MFRWAVVGLGLGMGCGMAYGECRYDFKYPNLSHMVNLGPKPAAAAPSSDGTSTTSTSA